MPGRVEPVSGCCTLPVQSLDTLQGCTSRTSLLANMGHVFLQPAMPEWVLLSNRLCVH